MTSGPNTGQSERLAALLKSFEDAAIAVLQSDGVNEHIDGYDKELVKSLCHDATNFRALPENELLNALRSFVDSIKPPIDLAPTNYAARSHGYDVMKVVIIAQQIILILNSNNGPDGFDSSLDQKQLIASLSAAAKAVERLEQRSREFEAQIMRNELGFEPGDEQSDDPRVLIKVAASSITLDIKDLKALQSNFRALKAITRLASIELRQFSAESYSRLNWALGRFVELGQWLQELLNSSAEALSGLTVGLLRNLQASMTEVENKVGFYLKERAAERPENGLDQENARGPAGSTGLDGILKSSFGIKIGTTSTQIYRKQIGVVYNEPSVIAYVTQGRRKVVYAVGQQAKNMLAKTPVNMEAIRPLRDGAIADFEVAVAMLSYIFGKIGTKSRLRDPLVVASVSASSTGVERRGLVQALAEAGVRRLELIERPMAAAIGAGLPIDDPAGSMVVDIGGGTSEVAVLSLGGIIYSRSVRGGGDKMDRAIVNYLRREQRILIGEMSAELIKKEIGTALPPENGTGMALTVRGRGTLDGVPKETEITEAMIAEALREPVTDIIDAVKFTLEAMPPELRADIVDRGIVLTGGGALLRNLDTVIRNQAQLPVMIADDPLNCVVNGCGQVLENYPKLRSYLSPKN